jgi:hypothetical protein
MNGEYRDAAPADQHPAGIDKRADRDATADVPGGALSPGTTASGSPTSGRGIVVPGAADEAGSDAPEADMPDADSSGSRD